MLRHILGGFALACALVSPPVAAQDRTVSLFDGHSLAGWRGDTRYWSVEDGAIVGRTTAEQPLQRNTFLVHDGEFGDFEVRFQFRIDGGNSGLQFRSRDLGEFVVAGPQADLEAGPNYTGMVYEEKGRGIMAPRGERATWKADGTHSSEVFGDRSALQSVIRERDWNQYAVRAVGGHITLAINGFVTAVLNDDDRAHRSERGLFAFQLHTGGPMEIRYRNIEVVELPADADPLPRGAHIAVPAKAPVAGAGALAEWIWSTASAGGEDHILLRREIDLASPASSIRVLATCDNEMTLRFDGAQLLHDDQWESTANLEIKGPIAAGKHAIEVECANHGGPAGFILRAEIVGTDGKREHLVTDRSWSWSPFDHQETSKPVHSFGPPPVGPWSDPFAGRTATPVSALVVKDGFKVELVRSAGIGEGSWIALGFDPSGRAIVSRERAPLARITPPGTAGGDSLFESLENTPRGSMGFTWLGDALFVQGEGPDGYGLFRLRDTDGDDRFDETTVLARFGGGGEHGAHAVVAGPDGMLWLANGNMSSMPPVIASSSPVRWQAEDILLPRLEDPRGHAVGVRIPGGRVLRVAPDGSSFELIACGFRNPYDIAFAPDGSLFTFDSDMEWDIGLPWYRPTRVCHVVAGADFGWRTGAGKETPRYPDSLPPVVDVGLSSPTGMLFGTGLAFHRGMRDALFVCDWAYGRILAVHLDRRGASWSGTYESFVTGKPLNVTDIAAGPDGALWFTTGGRGTQSGLYRVIWDGPAVDPGEPIDHFAPNESSQARAELEKDQVGPREGAVERVWTRLGSRDVFLRHAARVALEAQPVASWRARALAEVEPDAARTAWLALARVGDDADRRAVMERAVAVDWTSLDLDRRVALLRIVQVALARGIGPIPAALRASALARFDPWFPSRELEIDRELLRVLASLGAPALPPRVLRRMNEVEVAPRIDLAYSLREVDGDWSTADREAYFRILGALKTESGGMSFIGYLEAIEKDALKRVPAEMREALAKLAAPPKREVPSLEGIARAPKAWTAEELGRYLELVEHGRDFEKGRTAFSKAICAVCHRVDGKGGDIGPDLTAVSSRLSRRDLLTAVLDPSRDISDQYSALSLTLVDGSVIQGRIVDESDDRVEVMLDPISRAKRTLRASDIRRREESKVSPMPPALLNLLTLEEVLDLFAYLESGGNPNHPAFGK